MSTENFSKPFDQTIDVIDETETVRIILTYDPIDITRYINWTRHPAAGAISSFIGTTRDNHRGKAVVSLEYSCYPGMAVSETRKLCEQAKIKYSSTTINTSCCQQYSEPLQKDTVIEVDNQVKKIIVVHRLGTVPVSEASILIAVSTPHRELGLQACQFLIDNIKKTVPVWKKEFLVEGGYSWK